MLVKCRHNKVLFMLTERGAAATQKVDGQTREVYQTTVRSGQTPRKSTAKPSQTWCQSLSPANLGR